MLYYLSITAAFLVVSNANLLGEYNKNILLDQSDQIPVFGKPSTLAGIFNAEQKGEAQTELGTSTGSHVSRAAADGDLKRCTHLSKNSSKIFQPGFFVIGHVKIDDIEYGHVSLSEEFVAFFERSTEVTALHAAECYSGSIYFLNTLAAQLFNAGCLEGCKRVRAAIIEPDGKLSVSCLYPDGEVTLLIEHKGRQFCPEVTN